MNAEGQTRTSGESLAFTFVLWLVAGYIFRGSFGFAYPANVAPAVLGGAAFSLMTFLMARDLVRLYRRGTRGLARTSEGITELAAVFSAIGVVVSLFVFGFLVGMAAAMVALLRGYARERWPVTLTLTAVVMLTLNVAFGVALDVPLYGGLLGLG